MDQHEAQRAGQTFLRSHDLQAEHMLLDLGGIATEMHGEATEGQARGAVTLVKQGGMSIVLMHLHAGHSMEEHSTPGSATVQVLDGRVRIRLADETVDVPAGRLMAFNSGVKHSVDAVEDSTLLLTLVAG